MSYSGDALRSFNVQPTSQLRRDVRKRLFSLRIWSPRYKHVNKGNSNVKQSFDHSVTVRKSVPGVKLGVINCQSISGKLDFVFDHIKEYQLDIVALTETWLSSEDSKNKHVIDQCVAHGYSLHHSPRTSGRRGGGVGLLVSNAIKVTFKRIHVSPLITSFELMEAVLTICSVSLRLIVIYRMPPSKINGLKTGTFYEEFSEYLEKLSCASGKVIILGDFNINYLDTSGFAYKRFVDILETFDCVQHIDKPTHNSGHLLDYIITRKDSSGVSNLYVSDFISDHRALHVSLTCSRAHPERKHIEVRSLKRIQCDVLEADLIGVNIDRECTDVNLVVRQYDASLSSLLDKHAPSKRINVVERPMNDWMSDDILVLKALRRKYESLWRKTRLTVHFDMYSESCMDVKTAIRNSKSEILQKKISDCNGDQKKLFKIVDTLLGRNKHTTLPKYDSPLTMASVMNNFFIDKIDNIRAEFPLLEANLPCYSFLSMDSIMPICTTTLYHFDRVTDPELLKIISGMNNTTCSSDPFPTRLLMSHLYAIVPILQHIVNLCLTTGDFPISCKSSIVIPLIKKPGLDREMLNNYRPVSNLSFLSKVIEKVISIRILGHILDTNIVDRFQSAYRAGHSCETALLRVYNDIVTTVGKGNGSFLVLLDLSAAFDTIDHDNLFYILDKYVGIGGSALRLIRSYFSDRTQRVQIDGIMSDFASLLCGVPQGSVQGPMKFCLYLLPLGAILRHHNIGYHIYADDTQLYISFKCKDPLESLTRLNMCISDIRVWMIKNKLKINDSKTEFIIFRSPHLKQNLSDLSVSVGDMQVSPSSKVRDLGVVFDQYLTFHDHISGICKSTHFHLRGIGRIRNLLTFDATAQLIHALITSRLDFCNSILYNLPNKQIERLQRMQNQAARMLKRIPRRNHITPVLRELHWLRIHDRIIFKILLLTHKAVNNNAPEYLCDLIRLNVKSTTIRTRASFDPCLLCVPPISKTCANSFFDRSFVYAAPTLWNALDLDIRLLPFDAFKKRVKTHLYLKYFAN